MQVTKFGWKDVPVLITGASGYKGSWLAYTLYQLGARVYGTVAAQNDPRAPYNLLHIGTHITALNIDISEKQQVFDMINSIEPHFIFHLAAKAIVSSSLRDPARTFNVNINGALNILEACRQLGITKNVVICSTDHVFGSHTHDELPKDGFDERARVTYGGPYDTSKAAMELVARSYYYTYWDQLPSVCITRAANVFGGGDTHRNRVIPAFVRSAIQDGVIRVTYRENGRQFIHITDAVAGYIRAASAADDGDAGQKRGKNRPENRTPFTPIYHFAIQDHGGTNCNFIRLHELATMVSSIFNAKIDDEGAAAYAPNENKVQAINCDNTIKALQWRPTYTMKEGIEEVGRWEGENDINKLAEYATEMADAMMRASVD